jgi:hypothetical protein
MGVREKVNRNPLTAGAAAVAILAVAAVVILRSTGESQGPPLPQVWATVDDGRSYFAAPFLPLPPFEHEGREAVWVRVMSFDGGQGGTGAAAARRDQRQAGCSARAPGEAAGRRGVGFGREHCCGPDDAASGSPRPAHPAGAPDLKLRVPDAKVERFRAVFLLDFLIWIC